MTQPLNLPPGARRGRREGRQPNIRDTVRSIEGTPAERAADLRRSLPSGARLSGRSHKAGAARPAQQVEQFGRSATGEAVRGTFMLGGAAAGFKTGAALGALTGPAAPVVSPVLGAVGFIGGGFLSDRAGAEIVRWVSGQPLIGRMVAERGTAPEELRGAEFAGEIFGGSLPFGAGAMALATRAAPRAGKFVDGVFRFAREHPTRFASVEAASAGAASVAGGITMDVTDDAGMASGAALMAGIGNPYALWRALSHYGGGTLTRLTMRFNKSARETWAGKILHDAVQEFGGEPDVLMHVLAKADPDGIFTTAAQRTGDVGLAALEAKLAARSDVFRRDMYEIGSQALDNLEALLRGTGDPTAFAAAAALRAKRYQAAVHGRLQVATADVTAAARKLRVDSPETRTELSRQAREILGQALDDVRAVERQLWGQIPDSVRQSTVSGDPLFDAFDAVRAEMTREASLPGTAEATVRRMIRETGEARREALEMGFDPEPILEIGEIMALRSEALQSARVAAREGRYNDARRLGAIADGALEAADMAVVAPEFADAYDAARTFSRELNDTFSRSFAGRALSEGRFGDSLPPEVLLHQATASGGELTALRLSELESATRFLPDRDLGDLSQWQALMDTQERYIRLGVASAVGPDGKISGAALMRFMDDNAEITARFPGLRQDMQEAIQSADRLAALEASVRRAEPIVEFRAAFSALVGVDNPATAINRAIRSGQPDTRLTRMARMAVKAGDDARQGMAAAVYDDAIATAGGDMARLEAALFQPTRRSEFSVMQILQREGVISAEELTRQREVVSRMLDVQRAIQTRAGVEDAIGDPDALVDLVLRVVGARAGALTARGMGAGYSLIAAQRASTYMRHLFARVPETMVEDLLKQAMLDPPFASLLMQKYATKTPVEQLEHLRRVHAYMVQTGFMALSDDDVNVFDLVSDAFGPQHDEPTSSMRMRSTVQSIRGTPAETGELP